MTLERVEDGEDPLLDALVDIVDELHPESDCGLSVTIEWREDEGRWFMEHGAAEMLCHFRPDPESVRTMFGAWMQVQPHRTPGVER